MKTLPTINDVARHAGVSNMTVSRVVNETGKVKPETEQRVRTAMAELGYKPNLFAKSMRSNSTNTIGFMLPDLTNTANATTAQAAEKRLYQFGYRTHIALTDFNIEQEHRHLEQFYAGSLDGVILLPSDETNKTTKELIGKLGIPCVILDRDMNVKADRVISEHEDVMRTCIDYLSSLGHRRIGLIMSPKCMRPGRVRAEAYKSKLSELGLAFDCRLLQFAEQTPEDGYLYAKNMLSLENRPTAIIVGANQQLFGAIRAIRELGLSIPKDISIIGADETLASGILEPPLSMISRDMALIGRNAADLLLEKLKSEDDGIPPRTITVPSQLILRSSCASPPVL